MSALTGKEAGARLQRHAEDWYDATQGEEVWDEGSRAAFVGYVLAEVRAVGWDHLQDYPTLYSSWAWGETPSGAR